jgi:hypothetical protein
MTDEEEAILNGEICQFCLAEGPDMRSLAIGCFYDVREVIPELIDDKGVHRGRFCKFCRSRMLTLLVAWRDEAILRRGADLDSDGSPKPPPGADIPYRINGAVYMLTEAEYRTLRGPAAPTPPPYRLKPQ